jgi:RNA-directed DNA polymerase
MKQFIPRRSIEYNDNWISRFIAQGGKRTVTGTELGLDNRHCIIKHRTILQKMIHTGI